MSRALKSGIFEALLGRPMLARYRPGPFETRPVKTGFCPWTYGDVCLNYDIGMVPGKKRSLAPPHSPGKIWTKPEYAGLTVVENPATSSPGLAFLLLPPSGQYGEDPVTSISGKGCNKNNLAVWVTDGWEGGLLGSISAPRPKGNRPIVVSYASSPPAEVHYAENSHGAKPPPPPWSEPGTAVFARSNSSES